VGGEKPKSLETQYYACLKDIRARMDSTAVDPLINRFERAAKAATLPASQERSGQGTDTAANNMFGLAMIGRYLKGS
jgi:hypothetical protein